MMNTTDQTDTKTSYPQGVRVVDYTNTSARGVVLVRAALTRPNEDVA